MFPAGAVARSNCRWGAFLSTKSELFRPDELPNHNQLGSGEIAQCRGNEKHAAARPPRTFLVS
jgi:hypothetical protein